MDASIQTSKKLDALATVPISVVDWQLQRGDVAIAIVLCRAGERSFLRTGGAHGPALTRLERELSCAGFSDSVEVLGSGWIRRYGKRVEVWQADSPGEVQRSTFGSFDLNVVKRMLTDMEEGIEVNTL